VTRAFRHAVEATTNYDIRVFIRMQEMMPDILLWLGIKRIDWLLSMSSDKYDAIASAGIEVMQVDGGCLGHPRKLYDVYACACVCSACRCLTRTYPRAPRWRSRPRLPRATTRTLSM
jgi:hypothetical protein